MAGLVATLAVDREAMAAAADDGYTTATTLADALVRRGVPFRVAHHVVGALVGRAERDGDPAARRPAAVGRRRRAPRPPTIRPRGRSRTSPGSRQTLLAAATIEGSLAAADVTGGTAPARVRAAIAAARARLDASAAR